MKQNKLKKELILLLIKKRYYIVLLLQVLFLQCFYQYNKEENPNNKNKINKIIKIKLIIINKIRILK